MPKRIFFFLFFLLFGCTVGPNYRRPTLETPPTWRFEEKEARSAVNIAWWEQFGDPVLNGLIQDALRENKEVRIAAARLEEFMGRYGATRAALFPQLTAGASAGRSRVSDRAAAPTTGMQNPADNYLAFLNANWEIDLWGKLRRGTEAARANVLATQEAGRAVVLTLVASVANAYVNLRELETELEIARRTMKSREESYRLFQLRFGGGVISEVELYQVKSEYEQALATVPLLEKLIAQQENALNVLLGRNPGPIPAGRAMNELSLPGVPAGLPSDLLANRPDIRRAEQDLIAANARIGVARAYYFPSISLTALFGYVSTDLSDLFSGPARTWSWAAPLTAPIFTAGAIRGQVEAAEAVNREFLIQYEQSIQAAFREVEDALIDQRRSRERLEVQTRQVDTLRNYARMARLRFETGHTSYLEVLDAERSLFNAELAQAQTKGALFQALVNLYKAMGGGWVVDAEQKTGG
jgi:multidrug efflux system outer membrane protein